MPEKISIAFIVLFCTHFDGSTLSKRGCGGTESAVIQLAKNLATLDFSVTVFCDCDTDDTSPGIYDNVHYHPINDLKDATADIVISIHSLIPFIPSKYYNRIPPQNFSATIFENIIKTAKWKVLSHHNTALPPPEDPLLEPLVVEGYIDEVLTQSDFQSIYILNCSHSGPKRNFEVLKRKIFQTRGGIERYIDRVDNNT